MLYVLILLPQYQPFLSSSQQAARNQTTFSSCSICSSSAYRLPIAPMKLTNLISTFLAFGSLVSACSHYKNCWCESYNDTERDKDGNIIGHYPNNDLTKKACIEPGIYKNQGLKWDECHRFRAVVVVYPGAGINNCDWRDQCVKQAGSYTGVTGYCRNKI